MKLIGILFRLAAFLAVALCLIAFLTSNTGSVTVSLFPLPLEMDMPVYVLALGMLALGILIGGTCVALSSFKRQVSLRRESSKAKRELASMENELKALRLESRSTAGGTMLTNHP